MTLPLVCVQPFAGHAKGETIYRVEDIASYLATRPLNFVQIAEPGYPLDLLSAGVSAAYSLRRMSINYHGAAVRLWRSSDLAELDIGFSGHDLDWAAVQAFAGSRTINVTKWYDQSGNGNDVGAFAGDAVEAAAITVSGVQAASIGGRPALLMNSTYNNWLTRNTAGLVGANAGSVFAVANAASANAGDTPAGWWVATTLVGCSSAEPNGVSLSVAFIQGGTLYSQPSFAPDRYSGSWLGGGVDRLAPVSYSFGTDQIFSFRWNTSDAVPTKGYIGGGTPSTNANATANDAPTNLNVGFGGNSFTRAFRGTFTEIIVSTAELSIGDSNALGSNQAAYYGVPWASIST